MAEYVFTVNSPEIGVTHKATVEIAEGSVSPSGNASIAVSLVVNYVWNDWATGTITDYFNGCQVPGLKIMKAEGARAYRLMEPYKEFFMTEYGYTEAQWAAYSCPYIEFSVVEGAAVTFKTFKADVYDSEAGYMIYGYLPSEFLEKYAELDALSQLLDSKTVMLAPFWAVSPEVGGWGADYPVYIELEGDFEF